MAHRVNRAVLIAAAVLVALPSVASASGTMGLQGGALLLTDDPGSSSRVYLSLINDPYGGAPVYTGTPGTGGLRAGAGCQQWGSTVACPSSGVQEIAGALGDGDDWLTVGGGDRTAAVPVRLQMGAGNDTGLVATAGHAVTVDAGEGADVVQVQNSGQPVTIDGGPGDDAMQATGASVVTITGGDGNDSLTGIPKQALKLDGGDGDDTFRLELGILNPPPSDLPEAVEFMGGRGRDQIRIDQYGGTITAATGEDDDSITLIDAGGDAELDAGAGDDVIRLGIDDIDSPAVGRTGRVVLRAGDGDDRIGTGRDGDEDIIDCGPGRDSFLLEREHQQYPTLENRYSEDCPPFPIRVGRVGRVVRASGKIVARATVIAPRPIKARLALRVLTPLLPPDHTRRLSLHKGANRVTFTLSPRSARALLRKRTARVGVGGTARSPSGDQILFHGQTTLKIPASLS